MILLAGCGSDLGFCTCFAFEIVCLVSYQMCTVQMNTLTTRIADYGARHHLAPVSGTVEESDPSPTAAAWREIGEETTLTQKSLILQRQGKSFTFVDDTIGRQWTIFPFAFRLKTPEEGGTGEAGIHIDWEHDSWEWHDPLRVEDTEAFGGVPRLSESLRRVYFDIEIGVGAGKVLSDGLETLRKDHQSGARQLAGTALGILRDVIRQLDDARPSQDWWRKVRLVSWHIWKNGRESMGAAIMTVLVAALKNIEQQNRALEEAAEAAADTDWKDQILGGIDKTIAARGIESAERISNALAKYLEETFAAKLLAHGRLSILTLSESSTIALGLPYLARRSGFDLDIRVLESRPLFEGVSLAGKLVEELQSSEPASKMTVALYPDAAVALAAHGADIVLLGADRVAEAGEVSNKTGSLPAILSAKYVATSQGRDLKVVVLAESEKVAPPGDISTHVVEENDPVQVTRAWRHRDNSDRVRDGADAISRASDQVTVRNVFFEWCPTDLIDVYITEHGVWTVDDIAKQSRQLGAEQERFFGDL